MTSKRTLNVFLLAMINVAAITSLKNYPLTAVYGLSSLFFFLFSAVVFFIPVSLVSAELATGWPQRGVYIWVKEAMGPRMGLLAIWLQWIENVIWYPTVLSFLAASSAFIFDPALAHDNRYIVSIILITFWVATFLNCFGMKISGWISTVSVVLGTIIPGALIIFLGFLWIEEGYPLQITFGWDQLIPDLGSINELVLLAGILLGFAGMEMSAVHAKEVKNPQKGYPKAILLAAIIILALSMIATLAIAIVVPKHEINLASGAMEAFTHFLNAFKLGWAIPIVAFFMALGALGTMSTWIVGPTKGILATAIDGDLPPFFQKTNKHGMPTHLLVLQGVIVSLLSLVFLFMPNVSSSYWMLVDLTALLYLIMYILMFVAAIVLRYKCPEVKRTYRIPGGNAGMWIIGGIGTVGCFFTFIMGLFPPSQLQTGNMLFYYSFLIGGLVIFCVLPFIIYQLKKPSWKQKSEKDY